jgi:hypothetical protein
MLATCRYALFIGMLYLLPECVDMQTCYYRHITCLLYLRHTRLRTMFLFTKCHLRNGTLEWHVGFLAFSYAKPEFCDSCCQLISFCAYHNVNRDIHCNQHIFYYIQEKNKQCSEQEAISYSYKLNEWFVEHCRERVYLKIHGSVPLDKQHCSQDQLKYLSLTQQNYHT